MCRRGRAYHQLIRRSGQPSAQDTRHQLALSIVVLFGLFCVIALFAPDNPMLEWLLPFLAQQLALVVGYYFGQKGR